MNKKEYIELTNFLDAEQETSNLLFKRKEYNEEELNASIATIRSLRQRFDYYYEKNRVKK